MSTDITSVSHPSHDQLAAFNLGRLSDEQAVRIGAHLEGCPSCCVLLGELTGQDAFVYRVRAAGDTQPLISPESAATSGEEPIRKAGPYEIEEEIGSGGMGVVLRARDAELNRTLAVKVLLERLRGQVDLERRFREEAQITGQLQHPGIPPVHVVGRLPDGRPFFAMKLIKGRTLAELLEERSSPMADLPRFLGIFEQVCQTLAFAHNRRVIHRDLKPSNVMVGAFGEVQVMDWGLAKVLGSEVVAHSVSAESTIATVRTSSPDMQSQAGLVVGTLAYMSPEQARGEVLGLDERCDVFGLGALLCVILTGEPPFRGSSEGEVQARAARGDVGEALSRLQGCGAEAELHELACRCLAPEKADRPRDAGAVAQRITSYLAGVQERLRTAEVEQAAAQARAQEAVKKAAAERRARRLLLGLAAAVLLLVLAGGSGAWLWQQRRQQADAGLVQAVRDAHLLLAQARQAPLGDAGKLQQALAALKAGRQASSADVSAEVRRRAEELADELEQEAREVERDRQLLAALMEVRGPRDGPRYQVNDKGYMTEQAVPNADEQFAAAFQQWDRSFDVDRLSTAEAVTRLRGRPAAVRTEVIAALDEWASERRQQGMSQAKWQRPSELAAALDEETGSRRNELRRLMARGTLHQEGALGMLAAAMRPVPIPFVAELGPDRQHLRRLVEQTDVASEPVLGLLTLTGALLVAGDHLLAERLLGAAVRARPQEVALQHGLGELRARQGAWRKAVVSFAAARALRPELGMQLARALVRSGWVDDGLVLFDRLTAEQPNNPWLRFHRGLALDRRGRNKEAEAAYRTTIRLMPDFYRAHNDLGLVLGRQRRYKEAEAAFRSAIQLRPDDHQAHINLGINLVRQGRYKEAEAAFRSAIQLEPDNPWSHSNLGLTLSSQGRHKAAEAACRTAIRLKPNLHQAHLSLGAVLTRQGRHKEAEAACRTAIRLKPDSQNAQRILGSALGSQGRHKEAEAPLRQAIRFTPDDAEAHYNLGNALSPQGKLEEAEAAFRTTIRLKPDYAEAHCNLASVLRLQGRFTEALEPLRRGHALGSVQPGWRYPSAAWIRDYRRLIELDRLLNAFLKGDAEPASARERLELAELSQMSCKRLHLAAARLTADAFAAEPKLANGLSKQYRYHAACSAALAAAGQAEDARLLPDRVVVKLRRQAWEWLSADLALYASSANDRNSRAPAAVRQRLLHWRADSDLASVRDDAALSRLDADERKQWQRLWRDVDALLRVVAAKK
jgi:serine/threonine-protein kinase